MASKIADPRLKNLKIKTGVVKRLRKEKKMYEKEVIDQGAKIEKMEADGKDFYDIKQQKEVLNESKVMVPDSNRRLQTAIKDLQNALDGLTEPEVMEHEIYADAKAILVEPQA